MTASIPPATRSEDVVTLKSDLREAQREIRALRAELANSAPLIDDLKRQLVAARKQGERYRQQVEALRRSASWKLTTPLRAVRRRPH